MPWEHTVRDELHQRGSGDQSWTELSPHGAALRSGTMTEASEGAAGVPADRSRGFDKARHVRLQCRDRV